MEPAVMLAEAKLETEREKRSRIKAAGYLYEKDKYDTKFFLEKLFGYII